MYLFESYFPILPVEDRRKLAYSITVVYLAVKAKQRIVSDIEGAALSSLFKTVQDHDMKMIELHGLTNTIKSPF